MHGESFSSCAWGKVRVSVLIISRGFLLSKALIFKTKCFRSVPQNFISHISEGNRILN